MGPAASSTARSSRRGTCRSGCCSSARARSIEAELARHPGASVRSTSRSLDAPECIEMAEPAAAALRRKPRASIRVAAEAVRDGRADALFSAGHTGASVMAAHAAFGRLPGVDRPALATIIPTRRPSGGPARFRRDRRMPAAASGAVRAAWVRPTRGSRSGCESPRVGLLSVGEEESKGNELTREAHQLLKAAPVRFVGNVEGRDVYAGDADVIVCDGFTGNVTLKISEGLVETVEALLHDELSATFGDARRLPAVAPGVPPVPPTRRLLRVRRRAAARPQRPLHRRSRPLVGQGGAQRRRHGRALRGSAICVDRLAREIVAGRRRQVSRPS